MNNKRKLVILAALCAAFWVFGTQVIGFTHKELAEQVYSAFFIAVAFAAFAIAMRRYLKVTVD